MNNILSSLLHIDPPIAFLIVLLALTVGGAYLIIRFVISKSLRADEVIDEMTKNYHELRNENRELRSDVQKALACLHRVEAEMKVLEHQLGLVEDTLHEWLMNYPPDEEHIEKILGYLRSARKHT